MNLLSLYESYCEPLRGSKIYHKWCFLSILSALLERRCYLDQGRVGILFPNTYIFLVGPPATGKGFSMGIATDFYNAVKGKPMPIRTSTKLTQAALYAELAASKRSVHLPGQKPYVNSPAFLIAEELAQVIEDFGGGLLTNELIDFYDSKSLNSEIKKHTMKDGFLTLTNPSVVFLAGTQAEFLQNAQQARIVNSGLSSRILFVVEPKQVEKQFGEVLIDTMLRKTIITQLENIYCFKGIMSLTTEARAEYVRQGEMAQISSSESPSHFYKNYYGRKPMHILKISMVLAAMKLRHQITVEHIVEATNLIQEIEGDMVNAFGIRSIDKDTDVAIQLLAVIPETPAWCSKTQLAGGLVLGGRFIPDNGMLESTLKGLILSGIVFRTTWDNVERLSKRPNYLQYLKDNAIIKRDEVRDESPSTLPTEIVQTSVPEAEPSKAPSTEPDKQT